MLSSFQWWRQLRGGRWTRVRGYLWGWRWVPLPVELKDMAEEDWG